MLGDWRFKSTQVPTSEAAISEETVDEKNIVSTKRRRDNVDYHKLQLEVRLSIYDLYFIFICVEKV